MLSTTGNWPPVTASMSMLLLLLLLLIGTTHGDVHQFGDRDTDARLIVDKPLYSDAPHREPRNYTVVFKMLDQADYSTVSCVELTVNGINTSTQVGDVRYDRTDAHSMEVTLSVPNTHNVTVHLNVYQSINMISTPLLHTDNDPTQSRWLHALMRSPQLQSFTLVHIQRTATERLAAAAASAADDARPDGDRQGLSSRRYNAIGRRQRGDRLIHFRTMNVTNLSKFAERDIGFVGGEGQAISYVGFAFDSPTAVAFVNSSFVQQNAIAAIVYDLSADYFTANMSVFGYDYLGERPDDFRSIVRS